MASQSPRSKAASDEPVQPRRRAAPRPRPRAQNGSSADMSPMRSAPTATAATAVQAGAGRMKRFDSTLSATLAWSWMPGMEPRAERRLEYVEQS